MGAVRVAPGSSGRVPSLEASASTRRTRAGRCAADAAASSSPASAEDDDPSAKDKKKSKSSKITSAASFVIAFLLLLAIHADPGPYNWLRVTGSALLGAALAYKGWRKGSLDGSGALAAIAVGWGTLHAGVRFGVTLGVFFFTSSAITKLRPDIKAKVEEDYKPGGGRNWIQVFANGFAPTVLAVAYAVCTGGAEAPLGAMGSHPWATPLAAAFIGYYGCCCGDTWASELGVLSKTPPRLVTAPWRVVKPGTNGGMTWLGTGASAGGGLVVGLAFYLSGLLAFSPTTPIAMAGGPAIAPWLAQWPLVLVGLAAGLVGSLIDSFLGATIQFSGYCSARERVVSSPGPTVERISGLAVLSNSAVNLVSAILTAALAAWGCAAMFP